MRHLTDSEQQLARKILASITPNNLDGARSFTDAATIIDWIKANPHAAVRIATMAHAQRWFGCHCDLHAIATKTLETSVEAFLGTILETLRGGNDES